VKNLIYDQLPTFMWTVYSLQQQTHTHVSPSQLHLNHFTLITEGRPLLHESHPAAESDEEWCPLFWVHTCLFHHYTRRCGWTFISMVLHIDIKTLAVLVKNLLILCWDMHFLLF